MRHGGNRRAAAEQFGLPPEKFLDFSASLNPYPFPPTLAAALANAVGELRHYPDPEYRRLTAALVEHFGASADRLVLGNGTSELIFSLLRILAPGRLVTLEPTFIEYRAAAANAGIAEAPLALSPAEGFMLSPKLLERHLQKGDALFLCNPNNPTSRLVPGAVLRDEILPLCAARGVTLVLDEAFLPFTDAPESHTLRNAPGVVTLAALTKLLAIPGLRLGALMAEPELATRIRRSLPPWNVNVMAETAALCLLDDPRFLPESLAACRSERARFAAALARFSWLTVIPPAANYVLLHLAKKAGNASKLAKWLGPRGILIRLCHTFPGLDDQWVRVAVRLPEENDRLLAELAAWARERGHG